MEVKADNFIQQRLDSLYEIDCKIVSLLDNISTLFLTYCHDTDQKQNYSQQTSKIYSNLSTIAIDLRKEVRLMDENIGVYTKNLDNIMILPISVDQKNPKLGGLKLKQQLQDLNDLITNDSVSNESKDTTSPSNNINAIPSSDVAKDLQSDISMIDVEEKTPDVTDTITGLQDTKESDENTNLDNDDIFQDII